MWCIEAKAKTDIPLGENHLDWSNAELRKFLQSRLYLCNEFSKALKWLGIRDCKEAVNDCKNLAWLTWLKQNAPSNHALIQAGESITVTHGRNEKYALWHGSGIWDLPEDYVGETIKIISNN